MKILAIDPGNIQSAYCLVEAETYKPIEFAKVKNEDLRHKLHYSYGKDFEREWTIIEMVASYGMPVGQTVFDTCLWIGRFLEIEQLQGRKTDFIYRKDEKMNICHSMQAKDSNIRQALIDRFGIVGTKKSPRLVLWI